MKKVSVIVPVYNSEKYIERCLRSILNQSYQNLEIIVINDGSRDNSESIINNLANMDNRIVLVNQSNSGVSAARNKGLSLASGEFITFVDSDDYIDGKMYEIMAYNIEEYNADILECSYVHCSLEGESIRNGNFKEEIIVGNYFILENFLKKINTSNYLWNKMYRREVLKNLFFENYSYSEDYLFNIQALINSNVKITIENELYYYTINPDGAAFSTFSKKKMDIISVGKSATKLIQNIYPRLLPYSYEYILNYVEILSMEIDKTNRFEFTDEFNELINVFHLYYDKLLTEFPNHKIEKKIKFVRMIFNFSPKSALFILKFVNKIKTKIKGV